MVKFLVFFLFLVLSLVEAQIPQQIQQIPGKLQSQAQQLGQQIQQIPGKLQGQAQQFGQQLQNGFNQYNPFNGNGFQNLLPNQQGQQSSAQKNHYLLMAEDPVMFDQFDMKQFLCSSCRYLVAAAKRYYKQNPNNQQMIEFFQTQKFYDDLKDSCDREFIKSGARSGKFFGCQTVLIASITDVQQKLLEIGQNLPKENNQICFEKGAGACKSNILSVITGKK